MKAVNDCICLLWIINSVEGEPDVIHHHCHLHLSINSACTVMTGSSDTSYTHNISTRPLPACPCWSSGHHWAVKMLTTVTYRQRSFLSRHRNSDSAPGRLLPPGGWAEYYSEEDGLSSWCQTQTVGINTNLHSSCSISAFKRTFTVFTS